MALRTQAAVILIAAAAAAAQDLTFAARHDHMREGGEGTLVLSSTEIRWTETGKKASHSGSWKYENLQRIELAPDRIRLVTYEDNHREFGRDRAYTFDHLPDGAAPRIYALLAPRLDQRFIAHIAAPFDRAIYQTPAKLVLGRYGSNGVLKIGYNSIVFTGDAGSRAWRYTDVQSISSSGPFELTLNTIEGENRFQLKQPLARDRYDDLWRRFTEANGLTVYHSQLENHHEETH